MNRQKSICFHLAFWQHFSYLLDQRMCVCLCVGFILYTILTVRHRRDACLYTKFTYWLTVKSYSSQVKKRKGCLPMDQHKMQLKCHKTRQTLDGPQRSQYSWYECSHSYRQILQVKWTLREKSRISFIVDCIVYERSVRSVRRGDPNSPKVGLQNVTRHYASECKTHEKTTVTVLKYITFTVKHYWRTICSSI